MVVRPDDPSAYPFNGIVESTSRQGLRERGEQGAITSTILESIPFRAG